MIQNNNQIKPNPQSLQMAVMRGLLNAFVSVENRGWMKTPFYLDNMAIATDANTLIFFDKKLVPDLQECKESTKKSVLAILPTERNQSFVIKTNDLQEAFDKNECGGYAECKACYGSGVVDYEFNFNNKYFKNEDECPICDGLGKFSSLENFFIDIKECRIKATNINMLLFTAKKLESETIELVLQTAPNKPNIFKIKEVEILTMSQTKFEGQNVILNLA
jgi:hypothetical protein